MKIRWLAPILVAAMVALGGCAPSQTGGEGASPVFAPAQSEPSADAEQPSAAPAENPGPGDYDY